MKTRTIVVQSAVVLAAVLVGVGTRAQAAPIELAADCTQTAPNSNSWTGADCPGAPINVTPGATIVTALRTIVIEENNATERGTANVPLSVVVGTTTFNYGIQLGSTENCCDVVETNGSFSDRLVFQRNPDGSISVNVASDTNVGESSPAEAETYTVQNGNFIMRYEIRSDAETVPESSTLLLFGSAVGALAGLAWRRRHTK